MSKKKKEWKTEKGEQHLLASAHAHAHTSLANALLHLRARARARARALLASTFVSLLPYLSEVSSERLLSLGQEERRKEYGDNYVALDNIFTWRHHHREPEDDEENTVSLCDKVSLYKGDITMLEVDAIVNAGAPYSVVVHMPSYTVASTSHVVLNTCLWLDIGFAEETADRASFEVAKMESSDTLVFISGTW
ncbi:O-acetyl-ADP-ribose deacetylase MACROD2 isoform X1 [Silurus meridionalis]|nr:O-acetyl-ADP-ribose deacetylase MACROD2 isoform X1 [Silurus meridionalis]